MVAGGKMVSTKKNLSEWKVFTKIKTKKFKDSLAKPNKSAD